MGRPKRTIDTIEILQMRARGCHIKEISRDLGISTATLSRRIAELKYNEGLLTKYRELQGLQLTKLQFRILEGITPEKIAEAPLVELCRAWYILEKAQQAIQRGEWKFKHQGALVFYLMEMERKEALMRQRETKTE